MTLTGAMTATAERSVAGGSCPAERIEPFVCSRCAADGGIRGRGAAGELYYTMFGLLILAAAGAAVPACCRNFLRSFLPARELDLADLAALARCLRLTGETDDPAVCGPLVAALQRHRAGGGYAPKPGGARGTIYATFMAAGGLEDLGAEPDTAGFNNFLASLRQPDGGFAPDPAVPVSMTPVTAAAAVLAARFARPCTAAAAWLRGAFRETGGAAASRAAPDADLLSTAVALHALGWCGRRLERRIAAATAPYVHSLQTDDGGFTACRDSTATDVEYTFYGMLALGELAGFESDGAS